MKNIKLSSDQVNQFARDGVLVIRSFYEATAIEAVQRGIYEVIGRVLARHMLEIDRKPFSSNSFDEGFNSMIAVNRSFGSEVYDAIKQIPAFIRLLADIAHEDLVLQLRSGSFPAIAAGGYGIRIDNPGEDKYRTFWHQEYPSQLRSLNGIVCWSPLVEITPEIGPVSFCLGSHREGPLPVYDESENDNRSGAYSLKIHNEQSILDRYQIISPLCGPSDLVLIDFLTLHSSGCNRSARSRWTMQFRYFDFNEATGTAHGWKGSYAAGVDFKSVHPELFIN